MAICGGGGSMWQCVVEVAVCDNVCWRQQYVAICGGGGSRWQCVSETAICDNGCRRRKYVQWLYAEWPKIEL